MPLARASSGPRDHRGNLPGGETNLSMQSHVVGDTLEEKEHSRYLAHMEAQEFANFPRSIEINGVELPLYKFLELENLGRLTLKTRSQDFRDRVEATGSQFFENHPHLRLRIAAGEDIMLKWYMDVQVTLCAALGMHHLDHAAFGAPWASDLPAPVVHSQQHRNELTQQQQYEQHGIQRQRQMEQEHQLRQQQQQELLQQQQWLQQQQSIENGDRFEWQQPAGVRTPQSVPQHGGFALQPPHLQPQQDVGTRFDEAARIRVRNSSSGVLLSDYTGAPDRPQSGDGYGGGGGWAMQQAPQDAAGAASRFGDAARIRAAQSGGSHIFG
jgi:hypothetical protein